MQDTTDTLILTREELYEQIWATPAIQLAKTFGISDVAIGKICKKHNIPKPPLGYWTQIHCGKKLERIPLPPSDTAQSPSITIHKNTKTGDSPKLDPVIKIQVAAEKNDENRVVVPTKLDSPHPLVKKTFQALRNTHSDEYGRLHPRDSEYLDIAVGEASIDRALRVMDGLIKAMESRGYSILVAQDTSRGSYYPKWITHAVVHEEKIQFRMEEPSTRRSHVPTKDEIKYGHWRPNNYVPSGRLNLLIESYIGDGYQKIWTDGDRNPIEGRLNSFISGLIKASEGMKIIRLEREKREREWAEQERRRQEAERRRVEQEKQIRELESFVMTWDKSRKIREFMLAVESELLERQGSIDETSQVSEWISWARKYADTIDPIVQTFKKAEERRQSP